MRLQLFQPPDEDVQPGGSYEMHPASGLSGSNTIKTWLSRSSLASLIEGHELQDVMPATIQTEKYFNHTLEVMRGLM
jgi:hypothetical protein